jgi:tetratricopeptide (TPR) repeat protein
MSMRKTRIFCAVMAAAIAAAVGYAEGTSGRKFEWTTKSPEARELLKQLQLRIENFQVGPENLELAKKIVAADPTFAMGQYYLSAVQATPAEAEKEYLKAKEMAKSASDGERRFIEGMHYARVNQGLEFQKCIEPLEALARDYPGERLVHVILGQLYAGDNQAEKARLAFEKTQAIGPKTARVEAFLANDDLLNAMARINLENGRLEEAMKDYEKGYESVPGSSLPDDQKQVWLGRLHHGKARTLAKMGKIQEAWAETETIRKMIEAGGEPAKQYWPAYHYLAGYVKLEAGEYNAALEHLKQADMNNPFDTLLLARTYEKLGQKDEAKKTYQKVVDSQWPGIERPLAFPEASRKLKSL